MEIVISIFISVARPVAPLVVSVVANINLGILSIEGVGVATLSGASNRDTRVRATGTSTISIVGIAAPLVAWRGGPTNNGREG